MNKKFLVIIFTMVSCLCFTEEYEKHDFIGKHFLGSYYGCDKEILNDKEALKQLMITAIETSGATILDECDYKFNPHGITMLFLLAESHATIHTYPEYGACFVDIFTCGLACDPQKFDERLSIGLKSQHSNREFKVRD